MNEGKQQTKAIYSIFHKRNDKIKIMNIEKITEDGALISIFNKSRGTKMRTYIFLSNEELINLAKLFEIIALSNQRNKIEKEITKRIINEVEQNDGRDDFNKN